MPNDKNRCLMIGSLLENKRLGNGTIQYNTIKCFIYPPYIILGVIKNSLKHVRENKIVFTKNK